MSASNLSKIRLPPLPSVRDLVKLYRLRAIKQLSQNFLMEERLTDRIVKAAGNITNHYVCEIGPGPGSITRSILKRKPKQLIVVEKDPRFLPPLELLQEACNPSINMQIHIDDIMIFNLEECFQHAPKMDWFHAPPPINLIGNLPFSISTILIINWLNAISEKTSVWKHGRTTMTLTFQKEVAERMVAPPNARNRCRLSVICQLWCDVMYKFDISGRAFVPKPDVDVGVVTFVPLKKPLIDLPFELVEKVTRTIFNTRQKYCCKGGEKLFPEKERSRLGPKFFLLANVDPTARAFELTNEDIVRLCYAYKLMADEYPDLIHYDFRGPISEREIDVEYRPV